MCSRDREAKAKAREPKRRPGKARRRPGSRSSRTGGPGEGESAKVSAAHDTGHNVFWRSPVHRRPCHDPALYSVRKQWSDSSDIVAFWSSWRPGTILEVWVFTDPSGHPAHQQNGIYLIALNYLICASASPTMDPPTSQVAQVAPSVSKLLRKLSTGFSLAHESSKSTAVGPKHVHGVP